MICPNETFHCSTNGCIKWEYVCDGIDQCPEGDDELFCGKCVNNKYKCTDGTEMSCELSCSILGFIPCTKYRNRRTCLMDYPNAIGAYNTNQNSNQISARQNSFRYSFTNLFYDSSTRMFSILGAFSILMIFFLLIFVIIVLIRKRRYKLFLKLKKSTTSTSNCGNPYKSSHLLIKDKSSVNNISPSSVSLLQAVPQATTTSAATVLSDNEHNIYEAQEDFYYNEHKYQEISDFDEDLKSNENRTSTMGSLRHHRHHPRHQDYTYNLIPPPYNSAHMFENAYNNSNRYNTGLSDSNRHEFFDDRRAIRGKSTYV